MAQLIVRNLDDQLKLQIQMQANLKGISMEEMVRQILSKSISRKSYKTGEAIASHFKNVDYDFEVPELKGQGIKAPDFNA